MANNHRWERWSSSRNSSVHGNCLPEAIRPTNPVATAWKKLPVPATIAVVPHSELEAVPQTRLSVAFASAIQTYNIIVSRSPDSGCQVVDLIDWQHTSMMPPSLPEDFKDLKAALRGHTKYLSRCRLVHYHYITSTTTSSTTLPSMTPCTRSVAVSLNRLVLPGRVRILICKLCSSKQWRDGRSLWEGVCRVPPNSTLRTYSGRWCWSEN